MAASAQRQAAYNEHGSGTRSADTRGGRGSEALTSNVKDDEGIGGSTLLGVTVEVDVM